MITFSQGLNNEGKSVILESDIILVDSVTLHDLITRTYHDLAKEFTTLNLTYINELILIWVTIKKRRTNETNKRDEQMKRHDQIKRCADI